jgi:ABC-type bacteriocin/lantibiotic exporter with double-glycine peptidase domain
LLWTRCFFGIVPNQPYISNEISLQGDAGEFIGIVGPSGCGKSTLINLLLGFYHPEIGGIYYNDKDLRTCDIREVRRQIGTVLQHDSLLSGTIYDNIVAGRIFTKQEIDKVLDLSGFAEELSDFPMGLNTYLSVGVKLCPGGKNKNF